MLVISRPVYKIARQLVLYPIASDTINDEEFVGLKFIESANKSVWWKKVCQIHPELQVCMWGYIHICLIFAIGE